MEDATKPKISFDVSKAPSIVVFFGGTLKLCGSSLFFSTGLLLILEIHATGDSNVFFARGRPLTQGSIAPLDSLLAITATSCFLFKFSSDFETSSSSTVMLRCFNMASTFAGSTLIEIFPNISKFLFS